MVMLRTVVSALGVGARGARTRVRAQSGQGVDIQDGAVPAAGG